MKTSCKLTQLRKLLPSLCVLPLILFAKPTIGLGAGIGTLGATESGVVSLNEHLSIEGSYNNGLFYQPDLESSVKSTEFISTPKIQSLLATANYYFAANGLFHISGGLALNGNKADGGTSGDFTVGGQTYNLANFGGSISGDVKGEIVAPYVGIGVGGNPDREQPNQHFFFDSNLGVLYQGKPKTELSATNGANAAVVKTIENNYNEEAKKYEFYPVTGINLYYYL